MASSALWHEQRLASGVLPDEKATVPQTYRFCYPPFLHFGDAQQEYQAVQTAAVLFDLSDRTQIEMTGKDGRQFLHNFCTNDIKRLASGEGCEAFVTNAKGRILAHLVVFVDEDSVWIETTPHAEEALLAHFEGYLFSEDVQLHGRTAQFGELFLTGPESPAKLSSLNVQLPRAGDLHHTTAHCGDCHLAVRRVDWLGQTGFLLAVARPKLVDLWKELIAAGVRPGGAETFHAHRIESGHPLYGLDLNDENLAQEAARTQRAISFTKGCYLGQEPLARIDALGHVNRQLRSLKLEWGPIPEPGAAVVANDEQEIGVITSSALVPGDDRPVALGCLRTSHAKPETAVLVRVNDCTIPATVFWREQDLPV